MVAPINTILARTSYAELKVESVQGESAVTSSFAASPLKLLAPRSRGKSVWSYLSSFGGGYVTGDQTRLNLILNYDVRAYRKIHWKTQFNFNNVFDKHYLTVFPNVTTGLPDNAGYMMDPFKFVWTNTLSF